MLDRFFFGFVYTMRCMVLLVFCSQRFLNYLEEYVLVCGCVLLL